MSSRREIVVAVEYPWVDPEFPDPIEDAFLIPVIEELKKMGTTLSGATIDIDTYRKQRQGQQSNAD